MNLRLLSPKIFARLFIPCFLLLSAGLFFLNILVTYQQDQSDEEHLALLEIQLEFFKKQSIPFFEELKKSAPVGESYHSGEGGKRDKVFEGTKFLVQSEDVIHTNFLDIEKVVFTSKKKYLKNPSESPIIDRVSYLGNHFLVLLNSYQKEGILILARKIPWKGDRFFQSLASLILLLLLGSALIFIRFYRVFFIEPLEKGLLFLNQKKGGFWPIPEGYYEYSDSPVTQIFKSMEEFHNINQTQYVTLSQKFNLLSRVSEIVLEARGELNVEKSIQVFLKGLIGKAGYDRILIAYKSENDPFLICQTALKTIKAEPIRFPIPVDDLISPAAQVYRTGKPYTFFKNLSEGAEENKSDEIMVPIVLKDKVFGVIGVDNSTSLKEITPFEQTILMTLATQIGFSIENSTLIRNIQGKTEELEEQNRQLNLYNSVIEQKNEKLALQNIKHEEELEFAYHTQQALLPPFFPLDEGFDVAVYCQSARELGGDFYNFIGLEDEKVAIVIGDVSGKGVGASLIMAISTNQIHSSFLNQKPQKEIEEILAELNKTFLDYLQDTNNMYVTVFCAVLDQKNQAITYCKAGHCTPLMVKKGGSLIPLEGGGCFVGMFEELYLDTQTVAFEKGDRLYLFTDGVTDNRNWEEENYGEKRLEVFLKENHQLDVTELVSGFAETMDAFIGETPLFDDTTLIAIENYEALLLKKECESSLKGIIHLKENLSKELAEKKMKPERLENFTNVLTELLYNALYHGNQKDPFKKIKVTVQLFGTSCELNVQDEGEGFNLEVIQGDSSTKDLSGLKRVKKLTDQLSWDNPSKTMTCKFRKSIKISTPTFKR